MAGRHPAHHAWCLVRPARCEGERKGRCPKSALQMPTAATLPRRGISKMVSGMTATIQTLLLLLAVLVVVAVAARRLNTAPSILLVIAGIGLALTPGLPRIELAPELVLLGILPPLIYSAGVAMSWREFRFNLRPITLLAFGCVVFTTCAVAAAVALAARHAARRRLRARRHCGAARRGCAARHRTPLGAPAPASSSCSKERVSPMTPRL